jgi:carboxyl-terminal processing protease
MFCKNCKCDIRKAVVCGFLSVIFLGLAFSAGLVFANKNAIIAKLAEKETELTGQLIGKYSKAKDGKLSADVDFNLFWDVWDLLHKDYVQQDKLNDKELFYGAIQGMVAAAGDPYTVFMNPLQSNEFSNDLAGTFEGIGAEIGIKKSELTIIAPLPESPAEKAGLRAGDNILAINKEMTQGMTVDQAVSKIRGKKGTEVVLTINRAGFDKPKEFKLMRDVIVVKSVKTEMRSDKIFVITISNFNNDTENLFNKAVSQAVEAGPKGIILDLRNDPGGYLETAIEVASEWIEDGVVVTEKYNDQKKDEYLARGIARLKDFSTVVLINQGSASASEIVAGALQDTGKATIVGMQSFGKGSVQVLENLNDGSAIKITVAKWFTPKGNNINEQGIKPDVQVDLTDKDYEENKDPQMDKAVEILSKK